MRTVSGSGMLAHCIPAQNTTITRKPCYAVFSLTGHSLQGRWAPSFLLFTAALLCGVPAAQFEHSVESLSEKKAGGLLGAYKEVSGSDGEVQEAAAFAAEQLSQRSNSLSPFKVEEVRALPGRDTG